LARWKGFKCGAMGKLFVKWYPLAPKPTLLWFSSYPLTNVHNLNSATHTLYTTFDRMDPWIYNRSHPVPEYLVLLNPLEVQIAPYYIALSFQSLEEQWHNSLIELTI